jgi:hypothetical protein
MMTDPGLTRAETLMDHVCGTIEAMTCTFARGHHGSG